MQRLAALFALALIVALAGTSFRLSAITRELEVSKAKEVALEEALQKANETIENLNSQISDAQGVSESSRAEMSEALESLEEGDTVEEP